MLMLSLFFLHVNVIGQEPTVRMTPLHNSCLLSPKSCHNITNSQLHNVVLLVVCFLFGPATDEKHFRDSLFVESTINLLGPGRT